MGVSKPWVKATAVALLLAGCGPRNAALVKQETPPAAADTNRPPRPATPPPFSLEDRLAWPKEASPAPDRSSERLYSLVAKNLPIEQALQIFARAYQLNLVTDKDATGEITVEFHDLPFDQAMSAMLDTLGLYWEREGDLVHVRSTETRVFTVDYVRLVRSGSGSSQAQVSSGGNGGGGYNGGSGAGTGAGGVGASSTGGGSGGGSNLSSGTIAIQQEDTVEFWKELETQLAALISKEGHIVINRMAGTIQVTDKHPRAQEVARFLAHINHAIHRQVDIDVKIVEVTLSDHYALGIDWRRVVAEADGVGVNFSIQDIITAPAGGFARKAPSLLLNAFENDGSDIKISAVIDALKEQGNVRVVSQPHIRTLNNQAGLIKVGTDRTFFRREQSTNITSAGATTFATDVPQVVTEGIVLAITPQISTDGWIMMDISPVVTRVSSVEQVVDVDGVVLSRAPNLDVRQSSSLVRAHHGETIVIGGLIQDQTSDTGRSVPGLGDVPFIGRLFRGDYYVKGKTELVMFMTPRLVEDTSLEDSISMRE